MWKPTDRVQEVTLEHGECATVAMSFTDGYGHLHLIWDDCQLMLVDQSTGRAMRHWPLEIVQAAAVQLAPAHNPSEEQV